MSLAKGYPWSFSDHHFKGYSLAGQCTSLFYNNAKVVFDVGSGLPFNIHGKLYCISHLHSDHGAGLPYILAQRSLYGLPTPPMLVPEYGIKSLSLILKEWMKIEGFQYDFNFIPVGEGFEFSFQSKYLIRAFPTTHRVPSFGYILYEKHKKLKKEFQNYSGKQLQELRNQGQKIEKEELRPLIAFTGDTQIEFINAHEDVLKSDILFLECTYLDEQKSIADTRKWGHTHFHEILENLEIFKNKHLCFIHLSSRYSSQLATKIMNEKLPANFSYSIFPRPI